jgi:Fe-S-cluster containining protein
LCQIWGYHPIVCKAYPFFDYEKKLKEIEFKYVKNFICPRKWTEKDFEKMAQKQIIDNLKKEIEIHNKIIREWNSLYLKNATQKKFFDYIENI